MEQTEGYKNVQSTIQELERRLKVCGNLNKVCEQSATNAEKEIEEHFAKCFNALASRKDALLKEIAQKVTNQKKGVEDMRVKLAVSIEACKLTLTAASAMYPLNAGSADAFFKEIKNVPVPNVFDGRITTELPMSLLDAIQVHGKVDISSRFSFVEVVTTFAGATAGKVDGSGLNARFQYPWGLCFNPHDGFIYVCDRNNNAIRKLSVQGDVSTFVDTSNELKYPEHIVIELRDKSFYVVNYSGHSVSKISATGTVSAFVGNGQAGKADGTGTAATFNLPRGIAIDQKTGNLFVSDTSNHVIRKVTPQGEVSTMAGSDAGFADGNGKSAKFNFPYGACFDEINRNILVCDYNNNKLRRINENGDVSTVCEIPAPATVSIVENKVMFVASDNNCLYKVTQIGQTYDVVVIAGTGKGERVDGKAHECGFHGMRGIAVHEASHSCFVAEYNSNAIRKISFASE